MTKRLARCALAALLAASFAAPVYASPPPVRAPAATFAVPAPIRLASAIALPAQSTVHSPTLHAYRPATGMELPPTVAAAKEYALEQLGATQYACLNSIVMAESKWNPTVWNGRGSGAYGIPQAWPAAKMASAGADWMTNPVTQVKWMLWYVATKYGSACGAAAYRDRNGRY